MLEAVLAHLHNYFVVPNGIHSGAFKIASGSLECDFLQDGQYFRIVGSVFNDGVYQYPAVKLIDEDFEGAVWAMAIPPRVVSIAEEIKTWVDLHPMTAYVTEAFGGYSYTRGTLGATGAPVGWEGVFRARLNAWRKLP